MPPQMPPQPPMQGGPQAPQPMNPTQQGMTMPGMGTANGQMSGDTPPQQFTPPDMEQGDPTPDPQETQDADDNAKLAKLIEQTNIAEGMKEKRLTKIGMDCYDGYMQDVQSRKDWEDMYENWMHLALQVKKDKVFPWPKAANVKYPILSTAAMQFNARAYSALVPSDGKVVKMKVTGLDPDGQKAEKAERVSMHMSYQIMEEMPFWEEDMDKLLLMLPIVGIAFKKTYFDPEKEVNCSKLVSAKDLVVNYWAKSVETAERKTERIYLSKRQIKERQLQEIYCKDVELAEPSTDSLMTYDQRDRMYGEYPADEDSATPYLVLEQHTYLCLDEKDEEDGYPLPYTVVFEAASKKVLRITARFDKSGIKTNAKGKLVKVTPVEYYTKFGFIPNPDGSFYDIGFGLLLGSINETVDTLINQLIDAGTLSNMQSGFIAKGLRLKMGETRFAPGEWKAVNATGDDLKKSIFPMPVRDPSNVLFELLNLLVTAGKELASVAEIMTGKMPGQNTPAGTTQETVDQSMQLFTSIYKRQYRSLTEEMRKIYRLNRIYLDPEVYISIMDDPVGQDDYLGPADDICPAADPNATSATSKQARAQRLMSYMQLGTLNAMEVTKRLLDADDQPNISQLLNTQPPPPDPKIQLEQMKAQLEQQKANHKMQIDQMKAQISSAAITQKMQLETQMQAAELQFKEQEAMLERAIKADEAKSSLAMQQQDHQQAMVQTAQQGVMDQQVHQQKLGHAQDMHQQKLQQQKEMINAKPKPTAGK